MANSREVLDAEGIAGARSVTAHDALVGQQIKRRRTILGLTQWQLADRIGISFQQLHKYEAGANRIPALRLHQISQALGASLDYFFEGPAAGPSQARGKIDGCLPARSADNPNDLADGLEELMKLFRDLPTRESRARFLKLARFYVREIGPNNGRA